MKRTLLHILSLISLIGMYGIAAHAQSAFADEALNESYRLQEIGKALNALPKESKRAEDFIPPHWKAYTKAVGDLNGDGKNETVMVLNLDTKDQEYISRLPGAKSIDFWGPNAVMIVIVRPLPTNMLTFEEANYDIATMPQDERDELTVGIKNGVLNIHRSTGGMERFDETYRFRDGSLIGYDSKAYPVTILADSIIYAVSENYLTGERIETTTTFKTKSGTGVDSVKRSTFKADKTEFSGTYSHCH